MIVPLEWLKEYINIKKSSKEIAESFTIIGLMLDKPIVGDIIDLEHRMDRSDWLSMTGVARDLAAYERLELKMPKLYTEKGKEGGGVEIKVECPEIIRRFNTRVFKNIKVKESPDWLKKRLTEYGMTPINNIVDITNYVMVELGNPMHAQDLSKFEKREIVLRKAKKDEEITTLDGTLIKMDPEMFVLAQNGRPIVLGGVVGGQKTAVDFNTTEIVLDAGNYDQAIVRKTARKLGIHNETVLRYDKFLHPKLTELAIQRATQLILELAGGEYYENTDYYPEKYPEKEMSLRKERLELMSGLNLDMEMAKDILLRLGYEVLSESSDELKLKVPFFRTDIEVEDDLVADVLRIYGYPKIPISFMKNEPPVEITPKDVSYEDKVRNALVNLGLHEHITDPLVPADQNKPTQVILENSQSSEKNALRTSVLETLYPIVSTYKKHGITEVGLFEIGNIYEMVGEKSSLNGYKETKIVQVVYEGGLAPYDNSVKLKEIYYGLLQTLGIKKDGLGSLEYNSFSIKMDDLINAEKTNTRVVDEYINKISEDISINMPIGKDARPIVEKIKNSDKRLLNVEVVEEHFITSSNTRSLLVRIEFAEKDITKKEASEVKAKILSSL